MLNDYLMAVENNRNAGMYTPELESDACGIGMIANLNGNPLHSLVSDALTVSPIRVNLGSSWNISL